MGPPEGIAPAPHQRQREPALPRPPGACGWLQVTREELKVMGGLPPLDHAPPVPWAQRRLGEKFFPNRGDTKIRENVLRIFGLKRDTRTHPTGHLRPAIIRVIVGCGRIR